MVVKLQIWDTAGQEHFGSIPRAYYRNTSAIVLMYDVTSRSSFDNATLHWLPEVQARCSEHSTIILVGNKTDLDQWRVVSSLEGEQCAEEHQLHFLEIFMHHCLLNPSTETSQNQSADNAHNLKLTATQGRKPSLQLIRNGKTILLNDWAESLFSDMQWIARKLDQDNDCDHYSRSLMHYHRFLKHPERTPSARILSEMATRKESFIEFTQRQSLHNHQYFMSRPMHKNRLRYYAALSRLSILEQTQLESSNENPCRNHSDHPLCRSA